MVIRQQDYRRFTDDQLMAALSVGDHASLGELVRRYETAVTRYVHRIISDYDRSQDLCQETFMRVHRAASKYRSSTNSSPNDTAAPVAEFATWLLRIARNLSRDELRARKRRPPPASLLLPSADGGMSADLDPRLDRRAHARDGASLESKQEGPLEEAARRETRGMVLQAIGALPRNDRVVLLLKDIRGLAYDQIAAMLRLPLGTVKSRVSRARHKFKERYMTLFEESE